MTIIPTSSSTTTADTTASSTNNSLSSLDNEQTFMQLLVAELKYQDPDNPVDPTEFVSQTAQLTEVQSVTQLQATDQESAAAQLIGDTVVASSTSGAVTGTVTGVTLSTSGGDPMLDVDGTSVDIDSVTQVDPPSTSTSSS